MADREQPISRDVADLIAPTRDIRRLERIWAMPDNPNALDRLLAVIPTSFYEALAVGYRIRLLREARCCGG
jgi:hypothetical protein